MESLVLKDVTHTLAQKKAFRALAKKKLDIAVMTFYIVAINTKSKKKAIPLKIVQR